MGFVITRLVAPSAQGKYHEGNWNLIPKRESLLHEIQRRMHERVMFAPIWEVVVLHAAGPRVEKPAIGITPLLFFPVPYEEMRLQE